MQPKISERKNAMKTLDLFNLYMGESRPDLPWSECEIGCLTVRLADDYDAKVSQLFQPRRQTVSVETGLQTLPAREGTWQATTKKHAQRAINSVLFRTNRLKTKKNKVTAMDRVNDLLGQGITARTTSKQLITG